MLPPNEYELVKHYKLNKLPAVIAKAEEHRLLTEAGLLQRPWLTCQICHSLWRLGRALVVAGHRLEQRYAPLALRPA